MRRLIIPLVFLAGGCASLDDVVGGISNTPEWFQEKRVEIRGEGYPDFSDVPTAGNSKADKFRLKVKEQNTRRLQAEFLSDERSQPADISTQEIDRRAAEMNKALVLPDDAFDDILTDAEIRALREKLRPPPIVK